MIRMGKVKISLELVPNLPMPGKLSAIVPSKA
jgi:hypothetical protein